MNITRDVIGDLWPLYVDGALSADSRAVVDQFLAGDPEWAAKLREPGKPAPEVSALAGAGPDGEVRSLNRIKKKFRLMRWMLMYAMIFTCMSFGRLISDTSFDVSPAGFIATASVAVVFWICFFVALWKTRKVGP